MVIRPLLETRHNVYQRKCHRDGRGHGRGTYNTYDKSDTRWTALNEQRYKSGRIQSKAKEKERDRPVDRRRISSSVYFLQGLLHVSNQTPTKQQVPIHCIQHNNQNCNGQRDSAISRRSNRPKEMGRGIRSRMGSSARKGRGLNET